MLLHLGKLLNQTHQVKQADSGHLLTSVSASGSGYMIRKKPFNSQLLGVGRDWLSTPTFPERPPKHWLFGLSSHGAQIGLIQTNHLGRMETIA